jgi:radical SAM superfamily enzyme YgiQ (UPF0313 family)
MARVALISPGYDNTWASTHPPINLGYIAANLEANGVEVRIIDELVGADIRSELKSFAPDIVGITATTPLVPDAYRVAKIAREEFGLFTVMGGKHANIIPDEALRHVDMVVLGEGERAMLDIVNGVRERKYQVPYCKDLDDLPPPAWHLMDMEFYLTARERFPMSHLRIFPKGVRLAAHITTRGCPFSCIFCYNSWRDAPLRSHSAKRVIEDIWHLVERYKVNALYLMDDDLFVPKKRFMDICTMMIDEGLHKKLIWGCQSTSNHVSPEKLALAKKAGCLQVGFGFESGSPRILKLLKKGQTTVEENASAVRMCKDAGIKSFATFMIGNPTETISDIQETVDFIKATPPDGIGVHVTTPFPGTELWGWCKEKGLIPRDLDWSIFTTGEVSIPACDTIDSDVLNSLREEIYHHFQPLRLFNDVLSKQNVFIRAIKDPVKAFRKLRYISSFQSIAKNKYGVRF